jgi:hypothetical protein
MNSGIYKFYFMKYLKKILVIFIDLLVNIFYNNFNNLIKVIEV